MSNHSKPLFDMDGLSSGLASGNWLGSNLPAIDPTTKFNLEELNRASSGIFRKFFYVIKQDAALAGCAEVLEKDFKMPTEPVCMTEDKYPDPLPGSFTKDQYGVLVRKNYEKKLNDWPSEQRKWRAIYSKAQAVTLARLTGNCVAHCLPVIDTKHTPEEKFYALIELIIQSWKPSGYFGVAALMGNLMICSDEDGIINMLDRIEVISDDIGALIKEMKPTSGFLLALMCWNIKHPEFKRVLMENCKSSTQGYTFEKFSKEVREMVKVNPTWALPYNPPQSLPANPNHGGLARAAATASVPSSLLPADHGPIKIPECFNCHKPGHLSGECPERCESCPDSGKKGTHNWHPSSTCEVRKQKAAAKRALRAKSNPNDDSSQGRGGGKRKPNAPASGSSQQSKQAKVASSLAQQVAELTQLVGKQHNETQARLDAANA